MDKKAQFFIISTIIITSTLVSLQGLFSGYDDIDTSVPAAFSEDFIFNNIKSEMRQTFASYECPDVEKNLKELKLLSVEFLAERRMVLTIIYDEDSVCAGGPKTSQDVNMTLDSFNGRIQTVFSLG